MTSQITRFSVLATLVALLIGLVAPLARAADPAFVGVLALAVEDDVAKQLGLSEETHEKLKKLVAERESQAVNLVLEIRDLPPDIRAQRIQEFAAKVEQEGLALLTLEQRSKLQQIRLQRVGMDSLFEPEVAKVLQLTDEQKAELAKLRDERARKSSTAGQQERDVIRNEYERRLRAVLTEPQKALWDQLAGRQGVALAQNDTRNSAGSDQSPDKTPASGDSPAKPEPAASESAPPDEAPSESKPPESSPSDRPTDQPSETPEEPEPTRVAPAEGPVKLRFSFSYQPWRDVIEWLAEQADLSLQSDLFPEGTFNYSDTREYTVQEAIDLINGVLVTKGYTLLRRGRLLTVLNLDDETPIPDILIEFVPVEELPKRGDFELVKTIFQLAKLDPTELQEELQPLIGPGHTMVIMPKSRQILVTETAGKLRLIQEVIERAENPSKGGGEAMTTIELEHATAEEVIAIARPLLGLDEESTSNDSIQIASDNLGTRLFVTGQPDKIQVLRSIVEKVDQASGGEESTELAQPQLITYPIRAADPDTVLAVLQTLLAGLPDVRLAVDQTNRKLIALARPEEHKLIVSTLQKLEGEAPKFEVIPLRRLDAQIALATIQNFFGSGGEGEEGAEGATSDAPVVDADPTLGKLFVRGTPTQIEQIKQMLAALEESATATGEGRIRLIPLPPDQARQAVEQVKRFWPGNNPIRLLVPSGDSGSSSRFDFRTPAEDRAAPEQPEPQPPAATPPADESDKRASAAGGAPIFRTATLVVQENASHNGSTSQPPAQGPSQAPEIRVEVTPNGVLLYSDDEEALDKFEQLLRTITGPTSGFTQRRYTVFFLKHAKAETALRLLQDIMGGDSLSSSAGSLIGDVASGLMGGGGGILGAMMGAAGGGGSGGSGAANLQGTGPINVVADPRLNALIVQAIPTDIQMLDDLLKIIDREDSLTPVETAGRPRTILIKYLAAEEVADIIKSVFADRVANNNQQARPQQPNPADFIRALRGGGRGGNNREDRGELPKMTVAVDSRSNAVIVTAPEQLYRQVEALVEQIDQPVPESTDKVEVVTLKVTDPEVVRQALGNLLNTQSQSSSTRTSGSGSQSGQPSFDADALRRRMEIIQRLRSGGGFTPGRGGFTPGRGGFTPGRGGFTPGGSSRGGSSRGGSSRSSRGGRG